MDVPFFTRRRAAPAAAPSHGAPDLPGRPTATGDQGLAHYLGWRAAQGRAVSPASRGMLCRADEALSSTRARIPLRGNVASDLARSDGEAAQRVLAARTVVQARLRSIAPDGRPAPPRGLGPPVLLSAAAEVAGAGNCQEFASAALLDVGTRLRRGERAVPVVSSDGTHAFVELEARRGNGAPRSVVVDAWADGPPVLKEDAGFAQGSRPVGAAIERARDGTRAVRVAEDLVRAFRSEGGSVRQLEAFLEARRAFAARHDVGAGAGVGATRVYPELRTMPDPPPRG